MPVKKLIPIIAFLFITCVSDLQAQNFYSRRYAKMGTLDGGIGYATYMGELTPDGKYFDSKPALSLGYTYPIWDRFNARLDVSYFQFSGSDQNIPAERGTRTRMLAFKTQGVEASLGIKINLFSNDHRFNRRNNINPYVFAGLGLLYFNPRGQVPDSVTWQGNRIATPKAGEWVSLRQYNTERNKYGPVTMVIPVGAGITFKLNESFDLSLEAIERITFTDRLDDISRRDYPPESEFSDPTAYALSKPGTAGIRGNPATNDYYLTVALKVSYYIPAPNLSFGRRRPGHRGLIHFKNINSVFGGKKVHRRRR